MRALLREAVQRFGLGALSEAVEARYSRVEAFPERRQRVRRSVCALESAYRWHKYSGSEGIEHCRANRPLAQRAFGHKRDTEWRRTGCCPPNDSWCGLYDGFGAQIERNLKFA